VVQRRQRQHARRPHAAAARRRHRRAAHHPVPLTRPPPLWSIDADGKLPSCFYKLPEARAGCGWRWQAAS
jgi:hypothetical protein